LVSPDTLLANITIPLSPFVIGMETLSESTLFELKLWSVSSELDLDYILFKGVAALVACVFIAGSNGFCY